MIQSKLKSIISLWVVSMLLTATGVGARTIELQVNLGTPVMEAGKIQKTFLKVGLRGFDLPVESDRASVNLAIVLDRSGSMAGEKLARAKRFGLGGQRSDDNQGGEGDGNCHGFMHVICIPNVTPACI